MRHALIAALALFVPSALGQDTKEPEAPPAWREISFPSEDGLEITADLYLAHESDKTPFIVLFHQAGWSRGEYREIAPKLNARGFNCMAVDQRSGKEVNGVVNETARRAAAKELGMTYVDAYDDLVAAITFARAHHAKGKVLAWGSSYSSALVLRLAGEQPELVDGVLSFAPGEYFGKLGKPADWITAAAARIEAPVFITSARKEQPNWQGIYDAIESKEKAFYLPETAGNHGSRALWEQFDDHAGYWSAVDEFLRRCCPPAVTPPSK